jgi:hypothetical protein
MASMSTQVEPITWRGKTLGPKTIIDLWRDGAEHRARESRRRIATVQGIRRKTLRIKLSPSWVKRNPEAAAWIPHVMPERSTLERDLIARIAAVEPVYSRQAIGFTNAHTTFAEECEAYMEEYRQRSVPFQAFAGKGMEDGEYGRTTIPAPSDMEGIPDLFDKLTERAYTALKEAERSAYVKDEHDKRKGGRYVKVDKKSGAKQLNPQYERNAAGQSRAEHAKAKAKDEYTPDKAKSEEAHADAVRRYLVHKDASTTRLIPAMDCVPYFVRGTGRERWKLAALVERVALDREDLLEADYGWVGMGDRLLLPRGYGGAKYAGTKGGQVYLYTAYLCSRDDDGHDRPLICYTVGGAGTWTQDAIPDGPAQKDSLSIIDLYDEYGLQGPLWSYHGGLHTEDDETDFYYQPYLWAFVELILGIEGNKTSMNAANQSSSFTGHIYNPDAQLAAVLEDAVVDSNDQLRVPKVPMPGEIVPASGPVVPFSKAQVGDDAWKTYQSDMQALREATAIDQTGGDGPSGHALVVRSTLAQVAKRQIRDGALDATVACGQDHLKIVHAYWKRFGVKWPLATKQERAVGEEMREGLDVAEFNPEWVGEDGNYLLSAAYPAEENLARIDLEMNLAMQGFGSFESVQEARGKSDTMAERIRWLEDQIWRDPATIAAYKLRVAKLRQDAIGLKILKLQQQDLMTKQGVPGMENGVPKAAISATTGSGGPSIAARSRGGIQAAEMGAASNMQDAQAQMQVGPQAAPGVAA